MNHNRFKRGRSTYPCSICKRMTRDTGSGVDLDMCPECYELAGLDNMVNDNGTPEAEWIGWRDALLVKAVKRGSDAERIRRCFTFLWEG
jgi:hypothetical protein